MAAWKCGWCGLYGHKEPVDNGWQVPFTEKEMMEESLPRGSRIFTTMECNACQGRSVAMTFTSNMPYGAGTLSDVKEFWRENDPVQVSPRWIEGKDFAHVPAHIAKAASEAHRCHSIEAYMAAILMARTSIEAAAKDHDILTGNLFQKIDALAEEADLNKKLQRAAHHVRRFGNDMAHGDIKVEVTEEDSLQVLHLLTLILNDLYEVEGIMSDVGVSLDSRNSEGGA